MLALLGIHLMETVRKKQNVFLYVITVVLVVAVGALLGTLSMVDYYGAGILTVFVFYLFRKRKGGVCWDKSPRFIGFMWKC